MKREGGKRTLRPGAYLALLFATLALAVNFWAWSLLSPLGTRYAAELSLSPGDLSLLLAMPVVVGSLGRLLLGAATDSFGGKKVFAAACLLAALSVCGLMMADTYQTLLVAAMLLGIGGATFVIGVPFISSWFPPGKRGLAIGLYSMGNAGTAVSGFLTPTLSETAGRKWLFGLVAVLLVTMAMIFVFKVKEAPGWRSPAGSAARRFSIALRSRLTWDLAAVYAIAFGAYVAFGVYLPVLLSVAYGLDVTDAAARAAGFVLIATVARPVGGFLSDKFGGRLVIKLALFGVAVSAAFVAFQPALHMATTAAYLSLAALLGCCTGAVLALIGRLAEPRAMGSITGIVGTIGGLGGFFPPLVLGFTYQQNHSYAAALFMLSASALVVLAYISRRFKSGTYKDALGRK